MKNIMFAIAVILFPTIGLRSQSNIIAYNDFQPDSILVISGTKTEMLIDLNADNDPDIKMYVHVSSVGITPFVASLHPETFELCCPIAEDGHIGDSSFWSSFVNFDIARVNHRYGFRFVGGQGYHYGWFETYRKDVEGEKRWACDRYAYCTLPNHPIQWGVTKLTDIGENPSDHALTLFPNPANGHVTIIGNGIQKVEVHNLLGQLVASSDCDGDSVSIDLQSLPQGVYLVTATDREGKKHVRKLAVGD